MTKKSRLSAMWNSAAYAVFGGEVVEVVEINRCKGFIDSK